MAITVTGQKVLAPPSINGSVSAVRATSTGLARPATVTGGSSSIPPPVNRPTQPCIFVYNSTAGNAAAWAHPGALIIAGRTNYNDAAFHTMAAGGATVLIYLDTFMDMNVGRYAGLLYNASQFGPAVPDWNGGSNGPVANQWGNLSDFRVGSILQQKLPGILNLILDENPHCSGFFLDDVGTWSWYPGFNFSSWSAADRLAYRNGAIAICQTARTIADQRDAFIMVNGLWQGGTTGTAGGGYPDINQSGCSLVDGGLFESQTPGTLAPGTFPYAYLTSTQWGSATPRHKSYCASSNVGNSAYRDAYINANIVAWANSADISAGVVAPWKTTFTDFGLPRRT